MQPTLVSLTVTNLKDGETVHQPSLLITGKCHSPGVDYISVRGTDSLQNTSTPRAWPVVKGYWKALVLLECGQNDLTLELQHDGVTSDSTNLSVVYQPLLQTPPLYLTILVAKDSPLLIDCPPAKHGAVTSAHNSLDAAVAKFRTTALMWQALTAEDMRGKGLGRRAFRFEEVS